MEYDSRGNLKWDRQSHGREAEASSPTVNYMWDYSAAVPSSVAGSGHNFDRLKEMLFPVRAQRSGERRELEFLYGSSATSRDSILNRITKIQDNFLGEAAAYQYAGTSRRVS